MITQRQSYNDLGVESASSDGFVSRKGVQFILSGKPFYANGFNAYWLMHEDTDPKVTHALENAAGKGLTIAHTWGFRDGVTVLSKPSMKKRFR